MVGVATLAWAVGRTSRTSFWILAIRGTVGSWDALADAAVGIAAHNAESQTKSAPRK
jgi:hypothetical protein